MQVADVASLATGSGHLTAPPLRAYTNLLALLTPKESPTSSRQAFAILPITNLDSATSETLRSKLPVWSCPEEPVHAPSVPTTLLPFYMGGDPTLLLYAVMDVAGLT